MDTALEPTPLPRPGCFTRTEYEKMCAAGIFGPDDKLELLHGVVVPMSPQGLLHQNTVRRLTRFLARLSDGVADLSLQLPFAAGPVSEPKPDLYLAPLGPGERQVPERAACRGSG